MDLEKYIDFLKRSIEREKQVLSFGLKKNKEERDRQKGRIEGMEVALYFTTLSYE